MCTAADNVMEFQYEANVARIPHSSLAAKFRSLMVRKTHNKRIVAIEHKMIRLIYLMLTRRKS